MQIKSLEEGLARAWAIYLSLASIGVSSPEKNSCIFGFDTSKHSIKLFAKSKSFGVDGK